MNMADEGKRTRRTIHISDEVWDGAELARLALCGLRKEYVSRSAFIEAAVRKEIARVGREETRR